MYCNSFLTYLDKQVSFSILINCKMLNINYKTKIFFNFFFYNG